MFRVTNSPRSDRATTTDNSKKRPTGWQLGTLDADSATPVVTEPRTFIDSKVDSLWITLYDLGRPLYVTSGFVTITLHVNLWRQEVNKPVNSICLQCLWREQCSVRTVCGQRNCQSVAYKCHFCSEDIACAVYSVWFQKHSPYILNWTPVYLP